MSKRKPMFPGFFDEVEKLAFSVNVDEQSIALGLIGSMSNSLGAKNFCRETGGDKARLRRIMQHLMSSPNKAEMAEKAEWLFNAVEEVK